jgi:trk system potassium uptake protein TrkH
MPDFRAVLFFLGSLLAGLAVAMLLPMVADIVAGSSDWQAFLASAAVTGAAGGALFLAFRPTLQRAVSVREAFLLTALTWIVMAAFAALPLVLSEQRIGFTDAYFEAVSGLTTTGSTVLVGLAELPPGLLLWRALLQGMGGIGIIVMAVAILPALRVGGMQLFRAESSDRSEKFRPRLSEMAGSMIGVYLVLLLACIIALAIAGMSVFDAICHALPTISTGGFSTQDASIGYYRNPAVEWIIALFMLLGGMTFGLLARAARGDMRPLFRDVQTLWYLGYVGAAILAIALWQIVVDSRAPMEAVRSSAFNVISVATTTGFVSEDFSLWGSLPVAIFFVLFFVGGCTGSTSGAVKVFRFCILGGVASWQIRQLVHPHRVMPPTYNGRPISDEVVRSVLSFFAFYIGCFAVLSVGLSAFGLDLVTSISGVAQALGNVGPGLGPIIGPAGNFATLPDGAKWLLSAAMLLGRLELLTLLVLLSPTFWRG